MLRHNTSYISRVPVCRRIRRLYLNIPAAYVGQRTVRCGDKSRMSRRTALRRTVRQNEVRNIYIGDCPPLIPDQSRCSKIGRAGLRPSDILKMQIGHPAPYHINPASVIAAPRRRIGEVRYLIVIPLLCQIIRHQEIFPLILFDA